MKKRAVIRERIHPHPAARFFILRYRERREEL